MSDEREDADFVWRVERDSDGDWMLSIKVDDEWFPVAYAFANGVVQLIPPEEEGVLVVAMPAAGVLELIRRATEGDDGNR